MTRMKMNAQPRIIFMGTPEFAVASLDALVKAGFNIVAAVTAPDKPAGRGMKMNESAVKRYAVAANIPVLQPAKLRDPEFIEQLRSLHADLQIVVAFRMLPEIVWNMPPFGTINVHASLLPKYRGAAPINWAIINGEKMTGITTFRLVHEIDKGNILLQRSVEIGEDETAGELHDKLKNLGARVLVETIAGLIEGTVEEKTQPETGAQHHAPKLTTETGKIDWTLGAHQVHNLVRGLSPAPGAFTSLEGKTLKVYRTTVAVQNTGKQPGEWETDSKTFLRFAAKDGWVYITELQLEGKKRMEIKSFLMGFRPAGK